MANRQQRRNNNRSVNYNTNPYDHKKKIIRIISTIVFIVIVLTLYQFVIVPSQQTSSSPTSSSSNSSSSIATNLTTGNSLAEPINSGATCDVLTTYYIEMVQRYGDSVFISCDGFDMLIDAGETKDGPNVKDLLLEKQADKTLDMLVVTHAHSDHYGGILTALTAFDNVAYILDFGYTREDTTYPKYLAKRNSYISKGAKYCSAKDAINGLNNCSDHIYLTPNLYLDMLDTGYYQDHSYIASSNFDFNRSSVAFILHHQEVTYYYGGDSTFAAEKKTLTQLSQVTVMKANHHGSETSNGPELLAALNPQYIIISTSASPAKEASSNQHPYQEALDRFYALPSIQESKNVYLNMTMGTIKLSDDGNIVTSLTGSDTLWGGYQIEGVTISGENDLRLHETAWFKAYRKLPQPVA